AVTETPSHTSSEEEGEWDINSCERRDWYQQPEIKWLALEEMRPEMRHPSELEFGVLQTEGLLVWGLTPERRGGEETHKGRVPPHGAGSLFSGWMSMGWSLQHPPHHWPGANVHVAPIQPGGSLSPLTPASPSLTWAGWENGLGLAPCLGGKLKPFCRLCGDSRGYRWDLAIG
ncbi:hypothetical protein KUCAC02_020711, partial [Chaenocephalus aceratus]